MSLVSSSLSSKLLAGDSVLVVELGVWGGRMDFSNSSNCPIKLKLGETLAFLALTKSYASLRVIPCEYIK